MDTVTIDGKEVPITEVVAYYSKKDAHEAEATRLRDAQAASARELANAAGAVQAIEQAKNDPAFARQLVDTVTQLHADSAFFRDTGGEPPVPPVEGVPPVPGQPAPVATPPVAPVPGAPVAATGEVLRLAQQIETMQRTIDADQAQRLLTSKLEAIKTQYPALDTDEIVKKALEDKLPLEHLDLLAGNFERERLAGVLAKKETNNELLNGLMAGGTGADANESLASLGLSLSASQLTGDSEVDYGAMSTRDAVAKAFADVGAPEAI